MAASAAALLVFGADFGAFVDVAAAFVAFVAFVGFVAFAGSFAAIALFTAFIAFAVLAAFAVAFAGSFAAIAAFTFAAFAALFFVGDVALPIRAESTISSDMRIALAVLVITACSKSSEKNGKRAAEVGAPGGSGPTQTPVAKEEPPRETQIAIMDKGVLAQQAKVALGDPDAGVPSDLPASLDDPGKGPAGKITIASKTSFDRTDLSADAVAERITKQHLAALGSCYRAALARDASIQGKATLALTVKPDGTIASAKATAPDTTLQSCFSQAMQTWAFPIPKDADGEPTDAGFQIALALTPE